MPSTVIRSYRYYPEKRELNIVFQTGRSYTYKQVPEQTFTAMRAALSKGRFFNKEIRDAFEFERNR